MRDDVLWANVGPRERRLEALDAFGTDGDLLVIKLRLGGEDLQRAHSAARRAAHCHVDAAVVDGVSAEYEHATKGRRASSRAPLMTESSRSSVSIHPECTDFRDYGVVLPMPSHRNQLLSQCDERTLRIGCTSRRIRTLGREDVAPRARHRERDLRALTIRVLE